MPGLNTKSYYTGVVDNNDLAYVIERFGNPRRVLPAPISRFKTGEHKGRPKINPHVSSFLMKDGHTVSVFHVKPVYYLHINGEWRPLSEVTNYHGNRKLILNNKWEQIEPWYLRWLMKRCELIGGQVLIPWRFNNIPVREGQEIYFTVTTVYPDPNPETTTVDGMARITGNDSTWATIHDATDATAVFDNDTPFNCAGLGSSGTSNQWENMYRGFFLFDTSSIDDTDSIDSAIFSPYVSSTPTDNFNQSVEVCSSAPASNTGLVIGDYDSLGSTAYATPIDVTNLTEAAYNDFTVNASGKTAISKTGVTKYGTRLSSDLANSPPTWSASVSAIVPMAMAEAAGTTSDPKLAVTHSAAAVGAMSYFMGSGFWGA